MAAKIEVEPLRGETFRVRIVEGKSESVHTVTLKAHDYQRLAGGKANAQELIRKSFEFLLEHEPKESILSQFDLPVIGRYFPQYEREIKRRLSDA